MTDRKKNVQDAPELPRDLEALHRELESLAIEERASFGPELARELESEFRALGFSPRRSSRTSRWALAASMGALIAAAAVPGARASLVRTFAAAVESVRGINGPSAAVGLATPQVALVAEQAEPAPRMFVPNADDQRRSETPALWVDEPLDALAPEFAYPVLLDPDDAERIVQLFYPRRLQEEGVGGEVRVMVWVDETGHATDREVVATSGFDALDRAALSALGRLRFSPARRGGAPVGSWVKFTIKFQPGERTGSESLRTIGESESVVVDAGAGLSSVTTKPN